MTAYNTALDQNPARLNLVASRQRSSRSSGMIGKTMAGINLLAFCAIVIGSYLTI
ncbi:MAG: hypothetical protein QNI97_12340 [Desulfobacterales bacterium]|nr:hypothetical protein [Desulfobacterales bacterium]MDJ0856370.1 hypothetical protein [Desulfobacterales bacterium]MDJ0988683.1 hypothetical protein [Desulfobacterales bacterium]